MKILGLPLPQLLLDLIEQGRWSRPQDINTLKVMTDSQFVEDFDFLDIDGIRRESSPIHLVESPKLADIYNLASSKRSGNPIVDDGILDIDKALFIAVNWSEEAICLDYRLSMENPRVVASVCKEGAFTKWEIIASDFDFFASQLRL